MNRPGDDAQEHETGQQCDANDCERGERHFAALLIKVLENVARCARGIDHPGDPVVDEHRISSEHSYAGAPTERIDWRRRLIGDPHPQDTAVAPAQGGGHFLHVIEREPDFGMTADNNAPGIEDAKPGERRSLRIRGQIRQAFTDLPDTSPSLSEAGRRPAGRRPRTSSLARSSIGNTGSNHWVSLGLEIDRPLGAQNNAVGRPCLRLRGPEPLQARHFVQSVRFRSAG